MLAIRRSETIQFGDFMSGGYKEKQKAKRRQIGRIVKATTTSTLVLTCAKVSIPALIVTIPISLMTRGIPAMAATTGPAAVTVGVISDTMREKIIHSFDPLVDLMVSLSLPIASVMITGGALMSMIGFKEKGYGIILSASLGYILVQLSPMFIDLLVGVGGAV